MSTTIIEASSIPLEERVVEKFRDEVSCQSGGKGASALPLQNNSDLDKVAATSLRSKPEARTSAVRLREDHTLKSGTLSEMVAVGVISDPGKVLQVSQAIPSGTNQGHLMKSATVCPTPSLVKEDQKIVCEDLSAADSSLSGQILHATARRSSCSPLLSTVAQEAVTLKQGVHPEVPVLLGQHSVPVLPFAQQYLSTVPSSGNAAQSRSHAGSSTVCGLLGSHPYPPVTGEQMHSSVALGIYLGQNIGSGLTGPSSLYDLYSNTLDQNLLNTANRLPVQSVGANYEVERWDSEVMSEFGKTYFFSKCLLLRAPLSHFFFNLRFLQMSCKTNLKYTGCLEFFVHFCFYPELRYRSSYISLK